ncbi:MAG TPA: glutamate--tRNA ligase [Bacilli bacterium]|nr:glutamate--tRNA ligase [Bacilli bacterium]
MKRRELAHKMFPDISDTLSDLEQTYPKRYLERGAYVTRFAPSPTGFLHTGSLFTALISKSVAMRKNGVFFVRLEDTDTKREVEGAADSLLSDLALFGLNPDEGFLGTEEKGLYGPYRQSDRAAIYRTVIKQMIVDNKAYPCFCSNSDLDNLRKRQEKEKVVPGYYGRYAKCSTLTVDQALKKVNAGEDYVVRFRSKGNHQNKIVVSDLLRGDIEIAENDHHIVILKGDGLPTYHFAHLCDDHFMRTTLVTRGEEWLSSLPLHVELFKSMNFDLPKYAHLPLINKLDDGKKRKLSKRYDEEAAVSYFINLGYPLEAILTYLMSIANYNFEDWWRVNKRTDILKFPFQFENMSLDGALFDVEKLNFFAREFIAVLTAEEVLERLRDFSEAQNDEKLTKLITDNEAYFIKILNIERGGLKPRKDFTYFADIYEQIKFFFDEEYYPLFDNVGINLFNPKFSKELIINLLTSLKTNLVYRRGNEVWFDSLKKVASAFNFALTGREYRANPALYLGMTGDVAEMLRIAIVSSKQSPNMYEVLTILGKKRVNERIDYAIEKLSK